MRILLLFLFCLILLLYSCTSTCVISSNYYSSGTIKEDEFYLSDNYFFLSDSVIRLNSNSFEVVSSKRITEDHSVYYTKNLKLILSGDLLSIIDKFDNVTIQTFVNVKKED